MKTTLYVSMIISAFTPTLSAAAFLAAEENTPATPQSVMYKFPAYDPKLDRALSSIPAELEPFITARGFYSKVTVTFSTVAEHAKYLNIIIKHPNITFFIRNNPAKSKL